MIVGLVHCNCALRNGYAGFEKFPGYFRRVIILLGSIKYFLDFLFDSFFSLTRGRDFPVKRIMI